MKRRHTTRQQEKILDAAVSVRTGPPLDEENITFQARPLLLATLPHSDPGDVPIWGRTNGNLTLTIKPDWELDRKTNQSRCVGIPFGTIPRLLLLWMTNEAVKTGSRRLELGHSLASFVRELGLIPSGGRWGTIPRLREQMHRLFRAKISFDYSGVTRSGSVRSWLDMQIAPKGMVWWDDRNPEQLVLFESWLEITEDFFKAITASPIPLNMEAISALKHSSMGLDLYALTTFLAYQAARTGRERFIPWTQLQQQLGADYASQDNFKKSIKETLGKIVPVYPGLRLGDRSGGLEILPDSRTSVPIRKSLRSATVHVVAPPSPNLSDDVIRQFRTRFPGLDIYSCKDDFDHWLESKKHKPTAYGRAFLGFAKKWSTGKSCIFNSQKQ